MFPANARGGKKKANGSVAFIRLTVCCIRTGSNHLQEPLSNFEHDDILEHRQYYYLDIVVKYLELVFNRAKKLYAWSGSMEYFLILSSTFKEEKCLFGMQ